MPGLAGERWLVGFDTGRLPARRVDVLVVGSGIAGLTAALHASRDRSVALVTKGELAETNTWYAQGGIAGAVGEADSVELHLADTLVVGQGLCDEAVVRAVVGEAAQALRELRDLGVDFDRGADGTVALAREGGHSLPRVLHSGDATGAAVQGTLTATLRATDAVDVFEHRFLVDLLVDDDGCHGALVRDSRSGALEVFFSDAVVLATGGAGQVYGVTTNPVIATGDGVAAAWRAGADVTDMEFVQFHPTALDHEAAPRFLVSEALRGEGAYLLDCSHERFMVGRHPLAELAPRDVVSREIEEIMARCGDDHVWLDARHLGRDFLSRRFPTIWQATLDAGYDLSTDLVPVVPAAHYLVGGVKVDLDGRTSVPGLFASGEVAGSGLHGANRLASNSLLEGLVFSRRIARCLPRRPHRDSVAFSNTQDRPVVVSDLPPAEIIGRLHGVSGRLLGMGRTGEGLDTMADTLRTLSTAAGTTAETTADLEVANLLTVAALTCRAARVREETRGCHSRLDHPERDDERWLGHIVMRRGAAPRFEAVARPAVEPDVLAPGPTKEADDVRGS